MVCFLLRPFDISSFREGELKLTAFSSHTDAQKLDSARGQNTIRSYWRNYFEQTDRLVWVVDTSDLKRLDDCKYELDNLLMEEQHKQAVVCSTSLGKGIIMELHLLRQVCLVFQQEEVEPQLSHLVNLRH
nr:ADP-ribosylation factor-like protein 2 [Tanacetum cinerariifolium]